MLTERFSNELLSASLQSRAEYHPFATASERGYWEGLPAVLRAELVTAGERYLNYSYPMLPATCYLEYIREGNRSRYENLYFQRRSALGALVIAECVEGQGRFLDDIINGVWCICEESTWVVPAHIVQLPGRGDLPLPDLAEHYIDLFAGETAGLLAWISYLLHDQLATVTPLITQRVEREMQARIIEPFLGRDDFWWLGFTSRKTNNWSPWVCSNMLTAFYLLETDPDRRVAATRKVLRSLDAFLGVYGADGGCDEGPSYWGRAGAALFECLEQLIWASAGKLNAFDIPLVGEIGKFITRAYIAGNYYMNFADGSAQINPPGDLIYRYGKRIGDATMTAMGAAMQPAGNLNVGSVRSDSLLRVLPALFTSAERATAPAAMPYLRDVWLPDLQVMVAREEAGVHGLYLAAKGGHNAESHNHNDVGQFIVYLDGKPMLVDAGVETYTAKTFSARRYELWTMQSSYHNLPTINCIQQDPGQDFAAREVDYQMNDGMATLELDIAAAYPPVAGVRKWQRTISLQRSGNAVVTVSDSYLLERPAPVMLSLLTPCLPEVVNDTIILRNGESALQINHSPAIVAVEPIPLTDQRMVGSWGDMLYRITLTLPETSAKGEWKLTAMRAVNC